MLRLPHAGGPHPRVLPLAPFTRHLLLTARNQEMAAICAAEAAPSADSTGVDMREGRSMMFSAGAGAEEARGMRTVGWWSKDAKEAVKSLGEV